MKYLCLEGWIEGAGGVHLSLDLKCTTDQQLDNDDPSKGKHVCSICLFSSGGRRWNKARWEVHGPS